jgi:general secretion pathway protein L
MSLLVILLPARERLASRRVAEAAPPRADRAPDRWRWLLAGDDAQRVQQSGFDAAAALPRAAQTVLVLAEADVSWHRVTVPKAPAARLRQALGGVLEDALLDEPEALHLALGPGAAPGREGFVAATDAPRLAAALAALEAAGHAVERVVPMALPLAAPGPARGHFHAEHAGDDGESIADEAYPWLTLADASGALTVRTDGGLLRQWLTPERLAEARFTASPVAAIAAERLLGKPVPLLSDADRALEAVRTAVAADVNLRQFELASRHRGTRAVGAVAKRLLSPEWRGVRWGLAALVAVMVVGLNVQAWQLQRTIDERKAAMVELVKATHPGVSLVLPPPLQMQRETDRLRAAAGRPGAGDLEALLAAAAGAWPDGTGPVQTLRFDSGSLTLAAVGWQAPQVQQFRDRLRGAGYAAEFAEGRVVVSRLRGERGLT